jgi:hypothetical protein
LKNIPQDLDASFTRDESKEHFAEQMSKISALFVSRRESKLGKNSYTQRLMDMYNEEIKRN